METRQDRRDHGENGDQVIAVTREGGEIVIRSKAFMGMLAMMVAGLGSSGASLFATLHYAENPQVVEQHIEDDAHMYRSVGNIGKDVSDVKQRVSRHEAEAIATRQVADNAMLIISTIQKEVADIQKNCGVVREVDTRMRADLDLMRELLYDHLELGFRGGRKTPPHRNGILKEDEK